MLKRIKPLGWLVIFAIVGLLLTRLSSIASGHTLTATDLSNRQTDIKLIEKLPSKFPGISLHLETIANDAYHIQIQRPSTKSEEINDIFQNWIDGEKNHFIDKFSDTSANIKEETPSLKIDVATEQIAGDSYNFIFTLKEEEHPFETKVFNVDTKQELELKLDDILRIDDGTMKTLREKLEESLSGQDASVSESELEHFFSDPHAWNWSINKEALTLYINEENNSSILKAAIPTGDLYLHFTADISEIIDMSAEQKKEMNIAMEAEQERIHKEKEKQKEQKKKKAEERAKQQENSSVNNSGDKYVALTFDDGPSKEVTPRILNTLEQHEAKATFFMIGNQAKALPETAQQVAAAGHEIGNHTMDHADLSKLNSENIHKKIDDAADSIEQATGIRTYFVRPPYGAYNDTVLNDAANQSDSLILWSIDSLDWKSRNANAVISEVQKKITPGAIILMHDIHPSTADALPRLLDWLESQGYQFVTVSQLLKMQGQDGIGPHYGNVE